MNEKVDGVRKKAVARFLGFSLVGVLVFFVSVPWNGRSSILIDHLISGLKKLLGDCYGWIIPLLCACYLWRQSRQREKKNAGFWFFYVQAIFGFLLSLCVAFGIGGEVLLSSAKGAVNATGNIICAVFLSSLFVPFLTDYGLIDALGMLCRPVMRRVFLTPGSSAVIGVSAFLGNYSVGHIVSRNMYDTNRFTEREMIIVAMGFSTCSIGLMLNLVNYLGLMAYWTRYVVGILAITFATTAIVSRIYPIRGKRREYQDGSPERRDEKTPLRTLFPRAWDAGVTRAAAAPSLPAAVQNILVRVMPLVCGITSTSVFVIVLGTLLVTYTGIFQWLGCIVWPVLKIMQFTAEEIAAITSGIGVSIMEPVMAGVINAGAELSLRARWVLAMVPYAEIVFFAGFVPSVYACKIPIQLREMVIVWAERVVISTIIALLLCPF